MTMKQLFAFLSVVFFLGMAGVASVASKDFDSSVTFIEGCFLCSGTTVASIYDPGTGGTFSVEDGESATFGFIKMTFFGEQYRTSPISATLAFDNPFSSGSASGVFDITWNRIPFPGLASASVTWSSQPDSVFYTNRQIDTPLKIYCPMENLTVWGSS
jgi:hypothetical protein